RALSLNAPKACWNSLAVTRGASMANLFFRYFIQNAYFRKVLALARRSASRLTGERCRNLADTGEEALDHRAESPVLQCDDPEEKRVCGQTNRQRTKGVIAGNQPPQHGRRKQCEVRAAGDQTSPKDYGIRSYHRLGPAEASGSKHFLAQRVVP